jgi:hypothetical protein
MADLERAREQLHAAIGASRELGPEYEDAVVDSFLERVDRSIMARVDARMAEAGPGRPVGAHPPGSAPRRPPDSSLVLAIVSLGTGIPLTAIAGGTSGLSGLLVAWTGIAAVNIAHAWGRGRS